MLTAGARFRAMMLGMTTLAAVGASHPAAAQDSEARLRKVEAEVNALQRKVFPGGDGRFFPAESGGAASASAPPATTAVTDILSRLEAVEGQLARLTGQVEQNTNTLALLTGRVTALEPRPVVTVPDSVTPAPTPASTVSAPVTPAVVPASSVAVPRPAPAAPAGPSAKRLAAVQAITKPSTDDAGEDEYSYGFRLWEAKFYPEAQQQLRLFVDKYPRHARISYARNLLGRAYMEDGKPAEAAPWFLKNYQSDKQGARAGDSLLYLAETMIGTGDTRRACIALAEFGETYQALATGRLKDQYEADRRKVTCN
jgi:TolA-binding protein